MHLPATFISAAAAALPLAALPAYALPPAAAAYEHYVGHYGNTNVKPPYLTGPISATYYPASGSAAGDDLLTGGLGKTGLEAAAPAFVNPASPTPVELRRNAIHTNYRAILDIAAAGGYGTLYGPNVTNRGVVTASEGKVAGWEYLTYADDGSGRKNATLMVQVPDSFDTGKACIVTATSSGSRGVYGAIGSAGEWGLKQGCAVAYTDKGTGNGLHDLMTERVGLIDGTRIDADSAGVASHFTADVSDTERAAFNTATPNRVAFKHAHSEQDAERHWGQNTLQAIRFAFYVLNERYGELRKNGDRVVVLDRANTLVIASSVSNGGTAALRAAEEDPSGLIDGVAVAEPTTQPGDVGPLRVVQGSTLQPTIGRPLLDYFSLANLYQPCAALAVAPANTASFFIVNLLLPTTISQADERCTSLKERGLVSGDSVAEQAADALSKLHQYGWLPDSDPLHLSHYGFATNGIVVSYANAHGRFSVLDNVCGYSFANTSTAGVPIGQVPALQAAIFANGNGVPPTSGVNVVYNLAANGAAGNPGMRDIFAASPSTGRLDLAFDGALCSRNLVTGVDVTTGQPLTDDAAQASARVRAGIQAAQLSARLRGTPTIIVQGRADTLIPVNHASRAYVGKNHLVEGDGVRKLAYIEVKNAQHFDAFLPFPDLGYASRYVPLHYYFIQVMNRIYDHLTAGQPLPPSQVIDAIPRGPGAPPITLANLPSIVDDPVKPITFEGQTLFVPD